MPTSSLRDKLLKAFYITIFLAALFGYGVWNDLTSPPPPTAAEKSEIAKKRELDYQNQLYLCRVSSACKKYDEARLECATAGSFSTCLRIKMGDVANFSEICSGSNDGAPALPLPRETPSTVGCFFIRVFKEPL
jgi:hypothetical protein